MNSHCEPRNSVSGRQRVGRQVFTIGWKSVVTPKQTRLLD